MHSAASAASGVLSGVKTGQPLADPGFPWVGEVLAGVLKGVVDPGNHWFSRVFFLARGVFFACALECCAVRKSLMQ